MKKADPRDILLIGDHHEAYYQWKERSLSKITLVHFDAHIDFGFHEVKDIPLIIREAKTLAELRSQLEKAVLFRWKRFDPEKLTHIGNYIYPAIRDGIVAEFYWVIPGDVGEFRKSLGLIKGLLRELNKEDPCPPADPPLIGPGVVKTRLYGKPLHISVLDSLPVVRGPVLLDIDTDYFVIDSLRHAEATHQIARREPWIGTDEFIEKVRVRIPNPRLTTISYSVNGGFTPMMHKTLGDELARGLGLSGRAMEDRLSAGEHFRNFREAFNRKDFSSARTYYRMAVKLNPAYKVPDNSYGPLYFQIRDYRRAEKEWQGMLQADEEDVNAMSGLGKIGLARRKYREAADCFAAALRLKPDHRDSLAGLAEAEFHLGHYKKAETLIVDFERLEPMQDYSRFLSGRIYEKTGRPQAALERYKEALQLGMDHVDLLTRLVRLSRRYERTNLGYLEKKCRDGLRSFLRLEKKTLLKEGRHAGVKRTEERFKKLLASFPTASHR